MNQLFRNAFLGFRSLRRTPAFTLTATLTLALGIGLSTAVFTVADALLIRRLPMRDQDRLVLLWGETRDGRYADFPFSWDHVHEFAARTRTLERVAYYAYEGAFQQTVQDGDRVSMLRRAAVSGDFFAVLGARPALGRALGADDDVPGAAPVAVLSYPVWQQQFGGDPNVLGRRISLHDTRITYTIVGVMPQGLDYPRGADFWATMIGSTSVEGLKYRSYFLIGRLAPGATAPGARDEVTALFSRAAAPFLRQVHGVVHSLPRYILGDTKPALLAFAVAAALLLVITCINVANLLLVRGFRRSRELAVRSALGASRGELAGQLLVENGLLAVLGGVIGVAVAATAVRVFVAFAPADLPRLDEVGVNRAALVGALGITLLATMLFALAPALVTSRVELRQMLQSGVRHSASRRSRLTTEILVAGQLALAVVVLSAAGLVARSLLRLERADLAFDPSHLVVGNLAIEMDRYATAESQNALVTTIVDRLTVTPGIVDVSPVVAEPFVQGWSGNPTVEGQTPEQMALNPVLTMDVVTPGYFQTLGLRPVAGRGFTETDRRAAPPVVVLSESAARHFWPRGDAVGKRVRMGSDKNDPMATVVGVVPDTRYRDLRDPKPGIYFPLAQSEFPFAPTNLVIRTRGNPAESVPAIRRAVADAAPGVLLASASPFGQYLAGPIAQPRFNALLLSVFAITAVVLAGVGLFGIMMTMVGQRARELGIRMALGATAGDIRALVMRRGMVVAGVGAGAGVVGAVVANRVVTSMLYEVSPTDVLTLGAVAVLLLSVAAVAALLPAQSSARIDPVVSLRADG